MYGSPAFAIVAVAFIPALHPGIPIHLPLDLVVTGAAGAEPVAAYRMDFNATAFRRVDDAAPLRRSRACRPIFKGALTHDLRLE